MKKFKLFHTIMKRTHATKIIAGFLIFVAVIAFLFMLVEPEINDYPTAVWYCYVNLFTIGFGDIVPVTAIGRILSVCLTIYATVVIALVTAVIVAFYQEITTRRLESIKESYIYKLEHLDELSKEELREISKSIAEFDKNHKVE